MKNPVFTAKPEVESLTAKEYPTGSACFDWIMTALSVWVISGYFLVGWASFHGKPHPTSPVSWAAPAYLGLLTLLLFLSFTHWRNRSEGYTWQRALPQGYGLSLTGVGLALIGGVLYPFWQQLFAPINGVATSLVIPALVVAIGLILIVAGPLRAARTRLDPDQARGWILLGPLVLSMTLALSILTNLTLFASPIFEPFYGPYGRKTVKIDEGSFADLYLMNPDGSEQKRLTSDAGFYAWSSDWSPDGSQILFVSEQDGRFDIYRMNADGSNVRNLTNNHALEFVFPRWSPDGKQIMVTASGHPTLANALQLEDLGIAGVILQSILLMGAVLLLVTGWTLPFGALTLMFTMNGILMAVFDDRYALVIPVLAAGILADLLLAWLKPSIERRGRLYLFAIGVPLLLYALYFLALQATQGIGWSLHLWLGALVLCGLSGWLVSSLIVSGARTSRQAASR